MQEATLQRILAKEKTIFWFFNRLSLNKIKEHKERKRERKVLE